MLSCSKGFFFFFNGSVPEKILLSFDHAAVLAQFGAITIFHYDTTPIEK